MGKMRIFFVTILSLGLLTITRQISAASIESKNVIFLKAGQTGVSGANYWLLNGSNEAIPTVYPTPINYWESLFTKNSNDNSSRYTLVDTCVDRYCQLVTLEINNGTIKNYQVKTKKSYRNMTGSTFSGGYIYHYDRDDYSRLKDKKIGLNWQYLTQYCSQAVANLCAIVETVVYKMLTAFNQRSDYCSIDHILLNAYKEWVVFVSPLETDSNCNEDIPVQKIKCAVRTALETERNHEKTAFCLHIDHGSTYNMNIRLIAEGSSGMIDPWGLPCATIGDDWTKTANCW
ncbi:hypothetical protein KAFR_0K00145 [Kazachstania africana CBS 2517]|uniref:Uncharacterized protein n=1 Tax=Kazachstania africana (strain ATCC 22294 / BCRC 22015 / CBS 2517 / CECT 1963 / NBRC 1671 / NRRL Y-8276) TaxID=1071382 RepID=H2B169_KAZAF|nr:hypothetical protein KAFR_0K00145 [Kazachstania africana CBS 2517]CCF60369.1 hypothetical protein KAFR_0K00145 [Kazachstania africana CBS 2517]